MPHAQLHKDHFKVVIIQVFLRVVMQHDPFVNCFFFFFASVLMRYDILTSQGDEILLRTANVDATRPDSCFRCLPKSSQMTMMTT